MQLRFEKSDVNTVDCEAATGVQGFGDAISNLKATEVRRFNLNSATKERGIQLEFSHGGALQERPR
jgi:cell envelope opacity-associated protein A